MRSLYIALAGMIEKFRYLKPALALVLFVVGAKMLTAEWPKGLLGASFNVVLLGVIVLTLSAGVLLSLLRPAATQQRFAALEGARSRSKSFGEGNAISA